MRAFIWGAIIGLTVTVIAGHVVALWNWEWPYYQNKIASQSTMDVTRTLAPVGALVGGMVGRFIQRHIRSRRRISN